MQILAIDLGKFKSVACDYDPSGPEYTFTTIPTTPQAMHDLFAERSPDRVVIEIGSAAGWIRDLCEAMELDVQVANPNHEAWRWKNIKRKTDKDDHHSAGDGRTTMAFVDRTSLDSGASAQRDQEQHPGDSRSAGLDHAFRQVRLDDQGQGFSGERGEADE